MFCVNITLEAERGPKNLISSSFHAYITSAGDVNGLEPERVGLMQCTPVVGGPECFLGPERLEPLTKFQSISEEKKIPKKVKNSAFWLGAFQELLHFERFSVKMGSHKVAPGS